MNIPKLWELRGWRLNLALFTTGLLEDFFFIGYMLLANAREYLWVMPFVYLWQSMHDSYYGIPSEVWQLPNTRRFEKLGSTIGAGLSLYLFPAFNS